VIEITASHKSSVSTSRKFGDPFMAPLQSKRTANRKYAVIAQS